MISRGINFSLCVNEATHRLQMQRGRSEEKLSHAIYSLSQWSRCRGASKPRIVLTRKQTKEKFG